MLEYEILKSLFTFLGVSKIPKKKLIKQHWLDDGGIYV
jgi:hypothetical protein